MKNTTLLCAALLLCILTFSKLHAQSPGQIVRPAGGIGSTLLNPNGDGYSSATTSGFTTDDIAQSEVPYKVVPPAITEPTGDLATGPSGGFTDIVKTVDGSGFYIYTDGTNLFFRLRIGSIISGSKGYSVLIDTDNKMGNTGVNADPNYVAPTNTSNGNPGFEYEVVLQTNFNVTVYNVDGTTNPVAQSPPYSLNSNSQISVALSTDGNNPDYFYDWYVPLSAIGSPTSIRLAATTVTSPNSALQGSRSDIYGIDDRNSSMADAWTSVVNAEPSISITNFSSLGTTIGATCTAAPTIGSPITTGTNIAVIGTWTRMDASKPSTATITLYKNGTALSTTATVNNGSGSWSITVPSVVSGDVFYAKAQASGESQCLQSDNVTAGCLTNPAAPTISSSSTKCISGTIASGATANIYLLNSSTGTPSLVTSIAASGTTFTYGNCSGAANQITGGTYMITATLSGCTSAPVFDCNTGGKSTANPLTTSNITITGPVYPFNSSISGSVPTSTSTQLLRLFVNDAYVSAVTVAANTTTYTISGLSLKSGDQLKLYLQSGTSCATVAASTTTVSCYNAPPVITTNTAGQLLSTASSISGTATANASITLNRTAPTTASWTTTANSSGAWTVTGLTLTSGETYTATTTSTSTCGTASAASAAASVVAPTTTCPTFTGTYTENSTSVTGSITTSATGTVRLYLDGVLEGSFSVTSTGTSTWTIASLNYALYTGGVLSVTFQAGTNAESSGCTTTTVTCTSPLTPTITPTSSSIKTGQKVTYNVTSNITSGAWYAVSDNTTGVSYGTSIYKTNTTAFTLPTNAFNTAGNYTVKITADKLTGCAAGYSTATINVTNTVLAVRFLNISVQKQTDDIAITWSVANEQNVARYEVERSYDCRNFLPIGTVQPGTGTGNRYTFLDKTYNLGATICYRIKQIDTEGMGAYSAVTSIRTTLPTTIQVIPNPARSRATVAVNSNAEEDGWLELLDLHGKLLYKKAITLRNGTNNFEVTNLNTFVEGVYVVKVRTATSGYYQKLIVE